MPRRSTAAGLSLLELLLTLIIMSILAATAVPGLKALLGNSAGELTMRRLAQAIEIGRIAAITSSSLVTLCRSSSGQECGGQWHEGVLVFTDANGNRKIEQQDRIIRHITFPDLAGELSWRAFQNRQYLQITALGFTRYQNGNFTYCPNDGNQTHIRQLIINRNARIRFAQDRDGDGIREDSRGRALHCD
jgi:type IV fimbrial biogenesis protein FimT